MAAGACTLTICLALQVAGTMRFLRINAAVLTRSVCGSVEATLTSLDERRDLILLLEDVIHASADEAIKQYAHRGSNNSVRCLSLLASLI